LRDYAALPAFLTVLYAAACGQAEQASQPDTAWIAEEIRALYGRASGEIRYFAGAIDLNNDGRPETIVHVVGPSVCGTGGCNTLVFTGRPPEATLVANVSLTRPPIRASSRSNGGWRNLLVQVSGGGIAAGYEAELRFDGEAYPSNATLAPARRAPETQEAETVISEFESYTEGSLAIPADTARAGSGPLGRWEWVSFQGMDDSFTEVADPSRYTLQIREDRASVVADCNRGTGGVSIEESSLQFTPFAVTRMACPPDSMGDRYLRYLGDVRSWVIANGDLYLSLVADGGIMRFRPGVGAP